MAVNRFFCKNCKSQKRTFKESPICCGEKMEKLMANPHTKILEPVDLKKGKSGLKNEDELLLKRAKDYARDIEMDDLIQKNDLETSAFNGWLSKDYKTKKKKVDTK